MLDGIKWLLFGGEGLRSGWRVLLFSIGTVFVSFIGALVAFGVMAGTGLMPDATGHIPAPPLAQIWVQSPFQMGMFPLLILMALVAERGGPWLVGLGGPLLKAVPEFFVGFLLGGAFNVLAYLVVLVLHLVAGGSLETTFSTELNSIDAWHLVALPAWFGGLAIAAGWEEILFRGYGFIWTVRGVGHLLNYPLAAMMGGTPASFRYSQHASRVVFTILFSLVFAAVHSMNPGVTFLSFFNTTLAGVWLAIAMFRSRALWMPWGLHLGWNFTMGLGLGIPISGLGSSGSVESLLVTKMEGPSWLMDPVYGLEGSVAATFALTVACIVAAVFPRRSREDGMPAIDLNPITSPGRLDTSAS